MIAYLHSAWAGFTLMIILFTVIYHLKGLATGAHYSLKTDFRLALFTLVVTGIQLLLGIANLFTSDIWKHFRHVEFGVAVKNAEWRLAVLEHPVMALLGFLFMLYGFRRMYYQPVSKRRYLSIVLFYTLGFLFVASRIPWSKWL